MTVYSGQGVSPNEVRIITQEIIRAEILEMLVDIRNNIKHEIKHLKHHKYYKDNPYLALTMISLGSIDCSISKTIIKWKK